MLPLTISYNYEIVYHRQKEMESLKSPFPCCFDRFFSFLHFLMAYFSTKFEFLLCLIKWILIGHKFLVFINLQSEKQILLK